MHRWHSPYNNLFNRSAPKQCIVCPSRSKAIRAHSISEARVLKKMAENGEAISIIPADNPDDAVSFGLQGIGKISTFSGFCAEHDGKLFASIDNRDYQPKDKEQEFFFAFRTLAQSFWYTLTEARMSEARSAAFEDARPARSDQISIPETARATERAKMSKSRLQASLWRDILSAQYPHIVHKNFAAMDSITIEFPVAYPVAYSGLILLRHGRSDHEMHSDPHVVAVNGFPQSGRYYAILTCVDADHKQYLEMLLDAYGALGISDNRVILSHLICGNSEAIAIRPSYWSQLDQHARTAFIDRWRKAQNLKDFKVDSELNIFDESLAVSMPATQADSNF